MSWEWREGGSRGMSWCSQKSEKYQVIGVGREVCEGVCEILALRRRTAGGDFGNC